MASANAGGRSSLGAALIQSRACATAPVTVVARFSSARAAAFVALAPSTTDTVRTGSRRPACGRVR
jgi:hypothetical protein